MRDSNANQKVLLAALAGTSNRSKLKSLAEQAREFVNFYAALAVRLSEAAAAKDKEDLDENDDNPLCDDHNVDRVVGDGNGLVAREIVAFLENLSSER